MLSFVLFAVLGQTPAPAPVVPEVKVVAEAKPSDWGWVAGTVSSGGFAALVGWYLLTRYLPASQDKFEKSLERQQEGYEKRLSEQGKLFEGSLERQQKAFETRLDSITTTSKDELKERRNEYKEALKAVMEHCEKESAMRDKTFQVELSSLSRAMESHSLVMEDLRAAISDLKPVNSVGAKS